MKISANLGYLFKELDLPDAIRAAAAAGFDAVECHYPYSVPASQVAKALADAQISMISMNTVQGVPNAGDFGLTAIPARAAEAIAAIDQALDYASVISVRNLHVLAGIGEGETCREIFIERIGYAVEKAAPLDIRILIEPINRRSVPGYFLWNMEQAESIVRAVNADNLKILFDCFHVQITQGDLLSRFKKFQADIGHLQISSVPWRNEPDTGEIDYCWFLQQISKLGYREYVGAEYNPLTTTRDGLGWLPGFRQI